MWRTVGRLPWLIWKTDAVTNNLSENAIRPFTLGRKNWLFSDSVEGAQASAIAYTMVEMTKAHNLKIYSYLSYVLAQRPDETWSDEQLAELAPWSEKLQTLKIWEWICSKVFQLKMSWGKFIGTVGLFGAYKIETFYIAKSYVFVFFS